MKKHRKVAYALGFTATLGAVFAASPRATGDRPWQHYVRDEMPAAKIPQIEKFNLKNGVQVYFLKADHVPLVHMQVYLDGGAFEVPNEKLGVHSLWGETVVFSGSQELDREKLSQYLEGRASTFSFGAGAERSAFTLTSMSHYFVRDVETTFGILQKPRFADDDFNLLKKRVLQEFARRDENPAKWAALGSTKMFWGGTVRGRYATIRTVNGVKRNDIVEWHNRMWRGERVSIAVTGSIEPVQLKSALEKTFGNLAVDAKAKPNLDALHVKPTAEPNALKILPKDIPQTTVIYKAPGMKHGDADYYTLRLFDFLLGGDSFNSYLTQKIRTEKGWAYSAYSSFETDDFTGSIMLFTQTANMNLPEVIAAIDDILAKPEDFISKDKITQAKRSLKNKFVFLFENPVQYMKLYLQLKWDGLPENYLNDYAVNLDKVTEADVLRLAKRYYKPENFSILLCGPAGLYRKKSAFRPEAALPLELEK